MQTPPIQRIQLGIVHGTMRFLNLILSGMNHILFRPLPHTKEVIKKIVIYKVGNIGDVTCAIPAFIAIRETYPRAHITLLSSPGKRGAPGANELVRGASYIDDMRIYYADEIATREKRKEFISNLRSEHIDLFIEIPDDWATFGILIRNMFFAKLIGARHAYGFRMRSMLWLFKNAQIDYDFADQETSSLLSMLHAHGIEKYSPEFIFPITDEIKRKADIFFHSLQWEKDSIVIGICPGGKGDDKRWPPERFSEVARSLIKKHNINFIIFGGSEDVDAASLITSSIPAERVLNSVLKVSLLESVELLKQCKFLLTNDTGIMHLASAVETPTVALFSARNVFGRWFPYGAHHKVLFHRFLGCDYKKSDCVKKSILAISVKEALLACEELLKRTA